MAQSLSFKIGNNELLTNKHIDQIYPIASIKNTNETSKLFVCLYVLRDSASLNNF